MRILGIDLAGKEENETGICILDGDKFSLSTIHTDKEILKLADKLEPITNYNRCTTFTSKRSLLS